MLNLLFWLLWFLWTLALIYTGTHDPSYSWRSIVFWIVAPLYVRFIIRYMSRGETLRRGSND
jgi:hypothetical protein